MLGCVLVGLNVAVWAVARFLFLSDLKQSTDLWSAQVGLVQALLLADTLVVVWRYTVAAEKQAETAHYQLRALQTQTETGLMQGLLIEYDRLWNSSHALQTYHDADHLGLSAVEAFRHGMRTRDNATSVINRHRFRVSRFFVKVRKLAEKRYLSEDLIVAALDRSAVELFLDKVDPLDQEVRALTGKLPNEADERFFRNLVKRYPLEVRASETVRSSDTAAARAGSRAQGREEAL